MPISSIPFFPHAFSVNYNGFNNLGNTQPSKRFIYSFKTSKKRKYLIYIEAFTFQVYVLKFFLKSHSSSVNRFTLLTNDNQGLRILSTCFTAIIHFKTEIDKDASFGFMGAQKDTEDSDVNTQRFRIYSGKGKNFFDPEHFIHVENKSNSSYLILDRRIHSDEIIPEIQKMFESIYSDN